MAKALVGHLHRDLRSGSRLAGENARLRARVAELEALVLQLQERNDALLDGAAAELLERRSELDGLEEMQPV